jgi:hypothetical protein
MKKLGVAPFHLYMSEIYQSIKSLMLRPDLLAISRALLAKLVQKIKLRAHSDTTAEMDL